MLKKTLPELCFLLIWPFFCHCLQTFAEKDFTWTGPGNISTCEGKHVRMIWNYTMNTNTTIEGYTFCYNPKEQLNVGCETIISHKLYNSNKYTEQTGYVGRTTLLGGENNTSPYIGMTLLDVTLADIATYSVWMVGNFDQSKYNTDCQLTVIQALQNISIVLHNATGQSIQSSIVETDTLYFIDVIYLHKPTYMEVIVCLDINGYTYRQTCISPCRFNQTFLPGKATLLANVTAGPCSIASNSTLTVAEKEVNQSPTIQRYALLIPVLITLVVICVIVLRRFRIYWKVNKEQEEIPLSPCLISDKEANAVAALEEGDNMPLLATKTGNVCPIEVLKEELMKCYGRHEFRHINPLLDDDAYGYFIDSVFVEVSLRKQHIAPIMGKQVLEDSIKQTGPGVEVRHVNDMIPSPGGERVLLTGFVGSGKTSLCLHWIYQYSTRKCNTMNSYDLVVFLRARALENNIYHSLANLLEEENRQLALKHEDMILKAFTLKPLALIIIDGYDEATSQQKFIVDNLVSCKTLASASVIVTSRPNFFHGIVDKLYDNIGFQREQQLLFLKKFKSTVNHHNLDHFEKFEQRVCNDENATIMFTSPMMAMTTCSIVSEGEEVHFESRVKIYQQLTDFLARRACYKYDLKPNDIEQAMPAFFKAAFTHMLDQNIFHFSRDELLVYLSPDTLDNVIVRLGYMSCTKYTLCSKKVFAYAFVHKSWAEFTAARYVMSLPIGDRCEAVCKLFRSGQANLEVLKFTLGLFGEQEPENLATLFKDVCEVVTDDIAITDAVFQDETEAINSPKISFGSCYLMMLLTDVDTCALPGAAARDLSRVCVAVRRAEIGKEEVKEKAGIDVSGRNRSSALALYASLLLATHSAQGSLHTVREVDVMCASHSPHSVVTRFPAFFAACAPSMTGLTQVDVSPSVSSTELGEVCEGLVASGLPCLTYLTLAGSEDLQRVPGTDLGPVARAIRTAAQLTQLRLWDIHCGEEAQLHALCAAVGEAAPQLARLKLWHCSISAQQYSALLLPALRERLTARGARLGEVWLKGVSGSQEEKDKLKQELREVADKVTGI